MKKTIYYIFFTTIPLNATHFPTQEDIVAAFEQCDQEALKEYKKDIIALIQHNCIPSKNNIYTLVDKSICGQAIALKDLYNSFIKKPCIAETADQSG